MGGRAGTTERPKMVTPEILEGAFVSSTVSRSQSSTKLGRLMATGDRPLGQAPFDRRHEVPGEG